VPANGVARGSSVDQNQRKVTIDTRQEVSPAGLVTTLSDFAKKMGKPIPNEEVLKESAKKVANQR
jgi:hypothetical protein